MKTKYIIFILLFATLFITSCDDTETLIPSDINEFSIYDFPQGNDTWDATFEDIYKEHGVQIIYKGFTEKDIINKSWVGEISLGSNYVWGYYTDADSLQMLSKFFSENVFKYLPVEISKRSFPPYLIIPKDFSILYDYSEWGLGIVVDPQFTTTSDGLDFWLMSPPGNVIMKDGTQFNIKRISNRILSKAITTAINRGVIVPPPGFEDGMNYSTIISTSASNVNYFLKRGFTHRVNYVTTNKNNTVTNPTTAVAGLKKNDFLNCVNVVMWDPDIDTRYAAYPEVLRRCKLVRDHLKSEYNIDIEAIAKSISVE